jgi:hypothetical protein
MHVLGGHMKREVVGLRSTELSPNFYRKSGKICDVCDNRKRCELSVFSLVRSAMCPGKGAIGVFRMGALNHFVINPASPH